MTCQTPMTADAVFDVNSFRSHHPEDTDFYVHGHLTADEVAELYFALYPEHRTQYPYTVDASTVRHTWNQFTRHADDCYLVTGDDEEPGPLDADLHYDLCTCATASDSEVGTGYGYRHAHPGHEGQPGAIPITWVSITPACAAA